MEKQTLIKERNFSAFNEKIYEFDHESGLHVQIIPKKGFAKKFAVLTTDFGSIDTKYLDENNEIITVPDGTAHFLEHKLYEQPDGDVMNKFAALGADCNAATGYSRTYYYFESTENFSESLDLLLKHVFHPYFTEENVNKEKGIIVQEINMYLDEPEYVCSTELMKLLYKNNPVKKDIAGTEESVMSITPEMLYKCHSVFYRPDNMCLTIIGDVENDLVLSSLERAALPQRSKKPIVKLLPDEPATIFGKKSNVKMDASLPLFSFGFKDDPTLYTGEMRIRRKLIGRIVKELLFGTTSDLYEKLYNEGYINYDFYSSYELERDYAMFSISGSSEKIDKVEEIIKEYIQEVIKNGIKTKEFLMVRNAMEGETIRSFDSPAYLGRIFGRFYLQEMDAFDYFLSFGKITEEEVNSMIKDLFSGEMAISIVERQD